MFSLRSFRKALLPASIACMACAFAYAQPDNASNQSAEPTPGSSADAFPVPSAAARSASSTSAGGSTARKPRGSASKASTSAR